MKRHDPLTSKSNTAVLERPAATELATAFPSATPHSALPAPRSPAPAKSGLKKLAFGAIPVKKEETKTAYPVYNDPEAAKIAARIKQRTAELEALEGALETDKAELKQSVGLFYFQTNHGKREVPSSISIPSEAGEVLISFQNRYGKLTTELDVQHLLGAERTEKFFRAQDQMTINCDLLNSDTAQEFVDEFSALIAKFGAGDAVTVKSEIKPVKEFHTARHLDLTIEENMALQEIVPIVAQVKTKGREEKK